MESIIRNCDPFICFSGHHTVRSQPCKDIFEHISIDHKIFTGRSIIRSVLRKNIALICTAVDLNTFLSAFHIILIIATECTACDLGIFHSAKFQKMRFQIIKKCSIFNRNIRSMSNAKSHKSAWCILIFHTLIIVVPGSSIDHNVAISIISAF